MRSLREWTSRYENLWEDHAGWWIDGFTDGADPEYEEQILPMAGAELEVLDMSSTSAVVTVKSRVLLQRKGAWSPASTRHGTVCELPPSAEVVQLRSSGAAALPFADESFDAAVACLVFEHIDDVDDAIAEVARVLELGGRFCFFLNHPILQTPDAGWIDDHMVDPPEQYWRLGPYLVEASTVEQVEKDVFIRFIHRPMSRYVNALAEHGLVIERMVEPSPPPGFLARSESYAAAAAFPRLLYFRLRKMR